MTGASGYIGRVAVDRLVAHGYHVHVASRHPPHAPNVRVHAVDLLQPNAPADLIDAVRPTSVLHFAWDVTPGTYWTNPANAAWRDATIALARAFADAGGRRFVGAGTCAEYDWSGGHCVEATTPLVPATIYGEAKRDAWQAAHAALDAAGISAAWGRIFWLFGGGEHASRLVPSVAAALRRGEPALCTSGEQIRDFLHVDDVASAFVALLESDAAGAVNIASGHAHRVRDVIEGLADRLGRPELVRLGARESNEVPRVTASVARLHDEVGWKPALSFDQALDNAARYWRS